MKSNPNKSVDKYIEQGELILRADTQSTEESTQWALVPTMRGLLHTRLSQLKVKTKILNELNEKFHTNTTEKAELINRIKSDILKLKVFVENAFYFDAERLLDKLNLNKSFPLDENGFIQFVEDLSDLFEIYDEKRFPLPEDYTEPIAASISDLKELVKKSTEYRQRRVVLVKNREGALNQFREILPPIRKWLWKMLPEGRKDEKLYNYGFKPYGK